MYDLPSSILSCQLFIINRNNVKKFIYCKLHVIKEKTQMMICFPELSWSFMLVLDNLQLEILQKIHLTFEPILIFNRFSLRSKSCWFHLNPYCLIRAHLKNSRSIVWVWLKKLKFTSKITMRTGSKTQLITLTTKLFGEFLIHSLDLTIHFNFLTYQIFCYHVFIGTLNKT